MFWDRPHSHIEINLTPCGIQNFTRAGRGEDSQFKRTGCEPIAGSKRLHERRHVGVRHRRVVSAGEFMALRQYGFEMTAPAGGIFTIAEATRLGSIKHSLNSTSKP